MLMMLRAMGAGEEDDDAVRNAAVSAIAMDPTRADPVTPEGRREERSRRADNPGLRI